MRRLEQLIQEAVVGLKLTENIWVDGGVFYSNAGMEAWASRDNPTYTSGKPEEGGRMATAAE